MVSSKDISVVVQGGINPDFTEGVLKSIRQYLPKSEIILSVTEGMNVEGLDFDEVIYSPDPGAEMLYPDFNQRHNLNRQIITTKNGIKKASRKYVFKTRTDIFLKGNEFLKYFDKYKKFDEEYRFVEKRVLICQDYVRKPYILPFHVGDWVFFGLKQDVENIWNVPLSPEPETTNWFRMEENKNNLLPQHKSGPFAHFRHRYCAEQYIWKEFLKKNKMKLNFDHMFDISLENTELTNKTFANNIVILSCHQYNIEFCKGYPSEDDTMIYYNDWLDLYKSYADRNCKLSYVTDVNKDYIIRLLRIAKNIDKLKKHGKIVLLPVKYALNWLTSLFGVIKALIRISFKVIFRSHKILNNQVLEKKEIKYFDEILKQVPVNTKKINVLSCASGESFVFAMYYDQIMQNKQKSEVFITTRPLTNKILKMFGKEELLFVKTKNLFFSKNKFYKNKEFNILFADDFWLSFWYSKVHFVDAFVQKLGLKRQHSLPRPIVVSKDVDKSLKIKCKEMEINLKKVVIISPEANSMSELPKEFWNDLVKNLRAKGYSIFCNVMDDNNLVKGTKSCFLTIEELYRLAELSKGVIGLRSGILELLLPLKKKMHIVYNLEFNSKNRHLCNFMENYTMNKYFMGSKAYIEEYEIYNNNDKYKVLKDIKNYYK